MTDIQTPGVSAYANDKSEKKLFRQLFIRQFPLLGSMNFTRMEGLSYGWALAPMLKKIYETASSSIPTSIWRPLLWA